MNRLVAKPHTATPSKAAAESHQRPWPAGSVKTYNQLPATVPMMMAAIETMLISPLAAAIFSERTISGIAPSFEVMNRVDWPPNRNRTMNIKGTLPTRLQPELPPARFTIGRHKEDDPAERQRKKMGMGPGTASREAGEEIDPDTLNLSALAMGFYSQAGTDALEGMPGVKDHGFFTPHHRSPFQIGSVTTTRIGFAHLPMVEVTALAADPGGFTTSTARPLAIAFAKAVGIVFDLYSPTFGTRRDRISTDRNPASPSFGKNKKMSEVVVNFEIPHEQLKRLDAEKREWFGYGSSRSKPRWGRTEIDRWLGLDKVKELAAWRQGQGLDRPARKKERPPTPAGGAPVIPLRSSFGRVTEPEPTAPAPDLDAAQVQAGRAWAARKMATRGKAVAVARRKLQSRLSDRNRAFWSGVLAWGQNE